MPVSISLNNNTSIVNNNEADIFQSFLLGHGCGKYLRVHNQQRVALAIENVKNAQGNSQHYISFCKGLMNAGIDVILFGTITKSTFLSGASYLNLNAGILIKLKKHSLMPIDIDVLMGSNFLTFQEKKEILFFVEKEVKPSSFIGFCSEFNLI